MVAEMPMVSIVTPSFNQAQFIEETILSVKGQDYPNLEHIVVDGGSTDGTIDILRRYEDKYNLWWVSEPDEGQSDAINKGFRRARGEIIGWLNSDDVYMPGAVQAAVDALLAHSEFGWVYGDVYWTDEHGRILRELKGRPFDLKELVCRGQHPVQPTVFFRHGVLEAVGYIDTRFRFVMDTDLFIRLGLRYPAGYIPQVMATRRLHPQAKTVGQRLIFVPETVAMLDKLFAMPDLPQEIACLKNLAYKSTYTNNGIAYFDEGQMREARHNLWRALWLDFRPFQKRTLLIVFLILQSLVGFDGFCPHKLGIHRAEARFLREHGQVFVDWFR